MGIRLKTLILSSLFLFAGFSLSFSGERLKVGDDIPKFFLKDINGNNFFLNEYIGDTSKKNVNGMLFSFFASYCKPCIKEVPEIEKLQEKYKDKGFVVYLINEGENVELANKFLKQVNTKLPVLMDKYLVLNKLIGNPGVPHIVLINKAGKVKFVSSGFGDEKSDEILRKLENEIMGVLGIAPGNSSN